MATVGAKCRSAVLRDNFSKEIIGPRETEQETRISGVLGQLLVGLERIGVEESERWRLLGKVVSDSMPRLRMLILERLLADEKRGQETTPDQLAKLTGCSRSTVDRAVEDLGVHGIVERQKVDGRVRIELTDWMRREWKAGWRT
jgi:DNA-binding transcriptional ArsR family regulator